MKYWTNQWFIQQLHHLHDKQLHNNLTHLRVKVADEQDGVCRGVEAGQRESTCSGRRNTERRQRTGNAGKRQTWGRKTKNTENINNFLSVIWDTFKHFSIKRVVKGRSRQRSERFEIADVSKEIQRLSAWRYETNTF